jgi:hypothetical protein
MWYTLIGFVILFLFAFFLHRESKRIKILVDKLHEDTRSLPLTVIAWNDALVDVRERIKVVVPNAIPPVDHHELADFKKINVKYK